LDVTAVTYPITAAAFVAVAARGVTLTAELRQEVFSAVIAEPEETHAAIVNRLLDGPGADCRSCVDPDAGPVEHDFSDAAWWHDLHVGAIPAMAGDTTQPVRVNVAVMRHGANDPCVFVVVEGSVESTQLDLAEVREAIRVLSVAERLLTLEVTEAGAPTSADKTAAGTAELSQDAERVLSAVADGGQR
jgi:hypothetical protein